ncbi:MAG: hypothetical protein ACI3V0_06715 [Faecousia sp.]
MKYDREKLYNEVWAEPVSTVSKRYGISNAALAKACRQRGIPLPPRGYWAKAKAGKQCRNQVTCMHLPLLTNEWTYYNCSELMNSLRNTRALIQKSSLMM